MTLCFARYASTWATRALALGPGPAGLTLLVLSLRLLVLLLSEAEQEAEQPKGLEQALLLLGLAKGRTRASRTVIPLLAGKTRTKFG